MMMATMTPSVGDYADTSPETGEEEHSGA